jgi:hypothetical protein
VAAQAGSRRRSTTLREGRDPASLRPFTPTTTFRIRAIIFGAPHHPTIIPLREQCGHILRKMCSRRRDSTFDYRAIAARAQRSTKIRHASPLHYRPLSI